MNKLIFIMVITLTLFSIQKSFSKDKNMLGDCDYSNVQHLILGGWIKEHYSMALNGNSDSQIELYSATYKENKSFSQCWLYKALENNNIYAQYVVARESYKNFEKTKDENELKTAIQLYEQIINRNETEIKKIEKQNQVRIELAQLYKEGKYVEKDELKYFNLMLSVAKTYRGDHYYDTLKAMFEVAQYYHHGKIVEQDLEQATYWYKKIIQTQHFDDNKIVHLSNAILYENGMGVSKNMKKAVDYYFLSAINGDRYSQYKMSEFYQKGIGVSRDEESAKNWQIIADMNESN